MSELINAKVQNGIAWIEINRPKALNALNFQVLSEFANCLDNLKKDKSVRAVIIKGAGDKAFVAGADIGEMKDMSPKEAKEFSKKGQEVFMEIENFPVPTIALINGYALGGGCELAISCDMRIASDNARLGTPEITLGVIPGFGGTKRLTRVVGDAFAKELMFTGRMMKADEALERGLVNRVVSGEELESEGEKLASEIADKSGVVMSILKEVSTKQSELTAEQGMLIESSAFSVCFSTEDQTEGMNAFLSKRKPEFKHQ
ncbi:enoyl-CoA hydratase-related protein [Natranaerofaba carboxydovora]|uniref:enoyl-CoA hydratase-related protein n=1 Tax=Natranaerofaba carboxydovora TaxID=2742683 RepID=UPI001F12B41D|nr:enoyl-CoA hydratase-related protein [Natranaerofaba carboxydovora]UMZ73213.1 Short-chain-enoyl-CoA hydratase [Natranaerofaba carboxydovora]